MHGQAVLKTYETAHLLPKTSSSIGRIGCDVIIDDLIADEKHAIIEYSASENRYVLHDLNSVHGTYVNDCRIQNTTVRLAHGDVVRFGYNAKPYEFLLECFEDSHFASQQKWHSPVQILVSTPRNVQQSTSLPQIHPGLSGNGPGLLQQRQSCVQPHPPLRSRPINADNPHCSNGKSLLKEAWGLSEASDQIVHEKDHKLLRMADEISRLAIFEQESKRKDQTIAELRHENAALQEQLIKDQTDQAGLICQKLKSVDQEISCRRNDINSVKKQITAIEQQCTGSTLTSQLADREKCIHALRSELDKLKHDYGMSQGLIGSLQREVQSKLAMISSKNAEVESLKKKVAQKDVQLSSISAKFARISEDRSKDELIESLKKEMKEVKLRLQASDSRASDQVTLLQSYKQEISKLQLTMQNGQKEASSAIQELDTLKLRFNELQRSERIVRVDLEQSKSRLDRFRMRIIRAVYSCPGISSPDDDDKIDDSAILSDIKKICEQRSHFEERARELESAMHDDKMKTQEAKQASETCEHFIREMISRLEENGHHTRILKHEKQVLSSLDIGETLHQIREAFVDLLSSEISWLSRLDESLARAGFDMFLSNEHPGKSVSAIFNALEDEKESHREAMLSISDLERKHEEELQSRISQLLQENEEKLAAEIEKMRIEEQTKFNENLEAFRDKQEEKRIEIIKNEAGKVESLQCTIKLLQNTLKEKEEEDTGYRKHIEDLLRTIEGHETNEIQIKNDLKAFEESCKAEITLLKEQLKSATTDSNKNVQQYKEELHQHSITIVTLEKQTQTLTLENTNLEKTISDLKEKLAAQEKEIRSTPSPSYPNTDLSAMEQTIALLKSQLLHANHQIHMQQDAIVGLQKDLSGAQARISDMTGELSESQKQELEHNRKVVKHQEVELNTLRQQLIKMTALVDKQKQQIHSITTDLQNSKEEHNRHKNEVHVKEKLPEHKTDKIFQETQTETLHQEGKIVSDLTRIGASCKGERHENVIMRQREALAELRARIKALEQTRPPLPSQEQALQQVTLLKKELAEIRAKQAMEEDQLAHAQMSLEKDAFDTQQQIRSANTQASIERTARQHLEEGIIYSEKNYMDMLNAVAGLLNISSLKGMRSIQHVPQDEQERLNHDRKLDLELIANRIKSLLQRLDRKEHLLQGYEKDLNKLREAESFASKKSSRVAMLTQELMEKTQEIDHLREALMRARETNEVEKRLNKAIKERKTFHLENLDYRQPLPEGCSCYQTKDVYKEHTSTKERQEKLKRKQYEIDVLRQNVHGKEQDLCRATAQLVQMKSPPHTDEVSEIYNLQGTSHVAQTD